jgi:hypothetical protein
MVQTKKICTSAHPHTYTHPNKFHSQTVKVDK